MENKDLLNQMKRDVATVEEALTKAFEEIDVRELSGLIDAQKYSLFAGGKRIRPIIALGVCRMFGGNEKSCLPYLAALEMIHTASLIHDDLPSVDNDDLRRGKPTSHKVFGEAVALLAADGLFIDAFRMTSGNPHLSAEANMQATLALSRAAGTGGLVGGEYIDVMNENKSSSLSQTELMHSMKTGALIRCAATLGAISAGVGINECRMKDVITYADSIGLAFQIIDDILDATGSAESLGKTPGSDLKEGKTTYLSFLSQQEASKAAEELTVKAKRAVGHYEKSEYLTALADYLLGRSV